MTTATIDNTPVSEQVPADTDLTVPSNEVWKVTVIGDVQMEGDIAGTSDQYENNEAFVRINGTDVRTSGAVSQTAQSADGDTSSSFSIFPIELVLVGNDVIRGVDTALFISGFVVNDNYTP